VGDSSSWDGAANRSTDEVRCRFCGGGARSAACSPVLGDRKRRKDLVSGLKKRRSSSTRIAFAKRWSSSPRAEADPENPTRTTFAGIASSRWANRARARRLIWHPGVAPAHLCASVSLCRAANARRRCRGAIRDGIARAEAGSRDADALYAPVGSLIMRGRRGAEEYLEAFLAPGPSSSAASRRR